MEETIRRYPVSVKPYWAFAEKLTPAKLYSDIYFYLTRHVPSDSTPGVPLCKLGARNDVLTEKYSDLIVNATVQRMILMSQVTTEDFKMLDAVALVQLGLCDPVRMFIKNEPHGREKVQQRRFRLISSVSLIDNLVQRMLYTYQDQTEIQCWLTCPSKPGMGFSDEQASLLYADMASKGRAGMADISGWDWSVKGWELEDEAVMRSRLCKATPLLHVLILNQMRAMSLSVFGFSDGLLVWQLEPGIMKSGSKITSSSNSRIRVYAALLIGATWCIAMGDDSLESPVVDAKERYGKLGHLCKLYDVVGEDYEFCSQRWKAGKCYPLDPSKMLYKYLNNEKFTPELFAQFKYECRHHPDIRTLVDTIVAVGGAA